MRVRSGAKRKKLAETPGIRIEEDRVIFGDELYGPVMNYLGTRRAKKAPAPVQMTLEL